MGRILHVEAPRAGGAVRWVTIGAVVLLSAALGVWLGLRGDDATGAPGPELPAAPRATPVAVTVTVTVPSSPTVSAQEPVAGAVACPIQSLQLSLDRAPPRTICMDATLLHQTGSVRTFEVRAGDAEGWTLRIDMAERAVLKVVLGARDGRSYACEASACAGRLDLVARHGAAAGYLSLSALRLTGSAPALPQATASPGEAVVHARLRVPSDEQVPGLACNGPSTVISSPDGGSRSFCGQGGAGVEIADDGQRLYRFQDHEGRTLVIAVDTEQRVAGVTWGGHACRGQACRGASTTSADPANDLGERSFHFGRTGLFDTDATVGGGSPRPTLILDGTLVMPAQ